MKKLLTLALGILASLGGFVDIGDLVFAAQSGAKFGYSLIWALIVGLIGIMIYGEMAGRVSAVAKMTVFDIIRKTYHPKLGFFTLILSVIVNVMTCAAEIGGVALILQLLSGYSYEILIPIVVLAIIAIIWFVPFDGIERIFGYIAITLVIFLIAAIKSTPSLHEFTHGLTPHALGSETLNYIYFAIGLIAATIMPYEVYFYASGGIEEKWTKKDISSNRINSFAGFGLGALVAIGVMVACANAFLPHGINPDFIGTPALAPLMEFGKIGLVIGLIGMMFAIGGSAFETAFSSAYNLCQYAGWKWGRKFPPRSAPHFTWSWIITFLVAGAIIMTGVDPIAMTEYAVIFSVVIMPLTYIPLFKVARDKKIMGEFANKRLANIAGWAYLGVIMIISVTAVPLMIITARGQG